jgi:hypothetical protein
MLNNLKFIWVFDHHYFEHYHHAFSAQEKRVAVYLIEAFSRK